MFNARVTTVYGQSHVAPAPGTKLAKTILVADDSPLIRSMLCRMFEVETDYIICAEACNGQEAIALAIKHRPNLIILDVSMPVLNGLAAARELKQLTPDVPIILFTQYAHLGNVAFGSVLPFDRMASKTDAGDLMRHVRSLIQP